MAIREQCQKRTGLLRGAVRQDRGKNPVREWQD